MNTNLFYLIFFLIIGTHFGSFFTLVGLRLPREEDVIFKPSYCDTCKHKLSFLDMIPVLSYVFLKGRCRYCNNKISDLSTHMEVITGILFALSYFTFGFSYKLFIALGLISMLITISVSDISYYIIPDEILVFFSLYFLIIKIIAFRNFSITLFSLLSAIALFSIMYTIMLLGNYIFKKESLGGGDIKLMFVFGLIFHPIVGMFGIFLGSVLALPTSIFLLVNKNEKIVPFGPFLLLSFTFLYFTGIDFSTILGYIRLL